jgi:sulfide:quinone oxidoreductase
MSIAHAAHDPARSRVLIAGGGVAGLETLLALRALAPDLLDITILAPELKFINLSMSVDQPFKPQRVRGLRLQETAAELGARWHQGTLDRVEPERNRVVTLGAHPEREWHSQEVLTYHGGRDGPNYRLLLHQLLDERVNKLAFVKPAGPSWPLPLYDLALLTAANCAAHDRSGVELRLITPEEEPLGIFGKTASAAIRRLLDESGVTLHTSSYGTPGHSGWLDITPGDRRVSVDRVVTVPRLVGPRLRGIACAHDGFIATDALPGQAGWPGRPAGRRRRRDGRRLRGCRHRSAAIQADPARAAADRRAPSLLAGGHQRPRG